MNNPDIIVRRIPFAFDEGIDPVWHPKQREWSHMINGASLTMPYLEPFLIKTVREALSHVSDPQLEADVQAFCGQEGAHYNNHRRYNEILKRSYPELAEVEEEMAADYAKFQKRSLRWRLAYSAGFETMTMGVTEWLIGHRTSLFHRGDASVASLVLWHMVEETEHKNVAYDLYQHLYGDYWPKTWGLIVGSFHVGWCSRKGYKRMLQRDGQWRSLRSRLRLYRMIARFFFHGAPAMLRSLVPWYHPSKVEDPQWVEEWSGAYASLPDGVIPLLDTRDEDIPARFAT
ncbi:metal-dependent hydrolase [Parerythrobacter jejuensis]|uniref:Metal-dependent hydrolase n=1 Tax=Parerythrobacter jejuensis TaxID=795812 RepID=A0A845AI60_9SPHN|nr:metal-dependent hydrolase [Parerythrobacter jejuensis]MXP30342.1 metal-dependent hydrolase [Parerythrobacter jejuensis]MXP33102.1 metal-dependent hydrolase [Parerythrobacter jejuensis]